MILDVHERLALVNMLPSEGGYEELKTIRRTREMLSFTKEETDKIGFNQEGNRVTWDVTKQNLVVKDIPMDEWATNHFRKKLAELEKKGKLTDQTVSAYEKFVIMYK